MVKKPDVSLPNGNVYHYVVKMPLEDGKSMRLEKTFTELDNNGEAEISFYLPNGKYDYFELEMEIYLHFQKNNAYTTKYVVPVFDPSVFEVEVFNEMCQDCGLVPDVINKVYFRAFAKLGGVTTGI